MWQTQQGGGGGFHCSIPQAVCVIPPHTVGMIEGEQVKKEKTPPHFEVKQKKKKKKGGGGCE